ncbi:MAG: flagellar basal body P-ring formation protein FlgA [Ignavibacteriales bacterium]|nr:flagellar basal body P-ring formation protein FlgA [Ignavibacteriales bacterium]MBK7980561.1 flagellar basal body P-ring formation protein FlgA [Ignavibacteriota bacterium]
MNLILQILLSVFLLSNNNVIDNYLKDHLKDFKRYEYEIPKNYTEKIFPDENREFKLEKNYAYMPVNFILNNGEKKQGIVTLKVKLYDDVLVSIRDIKKNEELSISDFQIEEKEITSLRSEPILDFGNIDKYRMRISVSSNTVIETNMIEQIPDIKIGDNLNAVFNKGVVSISFSAVARAEGIIGDIIKIRTDDKKIFKAEIINFNTVKIVE